MDPITLTVLISAAVAAAGYGAGYGSNAGKQSSDKTRAVQAVRDAVKNSSLDKNTKDFIKNMTDTELRGYVDQYAETAGGFFGKDWRFDENGLDGVNDVIRDLEKLAQFNNAAPENIDYDALYNEAVDAINDENDEILAMYDADKERQTSLYNDLLQQGNEAYNRNVNQILSNDYQKNAQLMGTMRSEMQRSQRNALDAGASAGLRIAENINTMLSIQNRQSQQSLETSNNLAQMLLNQQQANAGLRSQYGNYLSQDTANRANLKAGTSERVQNYYGQRVNTEEFKHDKAMENYENNYMSTVGATNPFANSYSAYRQKSQFK